MSVVFVKCVLGLPLFTSSTSLLFHAVNDTMKVLISTVFFHGGSVFFVTFFGIFRLALLAPNSQPVRKSTITTKLAFVFQNFAFAASLHFAIHHFFIIYS